MKNFNVFLCGHEMQPVDQNSSAASFVFSIPGYDFSLNEPLYVGLKRFVLPDCRVPATQMFIVLKSGDQRGLELRIDVDLDRNGPLGIRDLVNHLNEITDTEEIDNFFGDLETVPNIDFKYNNKDKLIRMKLMHTSNRTPYSVRLSPYLSEMLGFADSPTETEFLNDGITEKMVKGKPNLMCNNQYCFVETSIVLPTQQANHKLRYVLDAFPLSSQDDAENPTTFYSQNLHPIYQRVAQSTLDYCTLQLRTESGDLLRFCNPAQYRSMLLVLHFITCPSS